MLMDYSKDLPDGNVKVGRKFVDMAVEVNEERKLIMFPAGKLYGHFC